MSEEEVEQWIEEVHPEFSLVYSHNFIDFSSKSQPLARTVTIYKFYEVNGPSIIKVHVPLLVHQFSFNDELIVPFEL